MSEYASGDSAAAEEDEWQWGDDGDQLEDLEAAGFYEEEEEEENAEDGDVGVPPEEQLNRLTTKEHVSFCAIHRLFVYHHARQLGAAYFGTSSFGGQHAEAGGDRRGSSGNAANEGEKSTAETDGEADGPSLSKYWSAINVIAATDARMMLAMSTAPRPGAEPLSNDAVDPALRLVSREDLLSTATPTVRALISFALQSTADLNESGGDTDSDDGPSAPPIGDVSEESFREKVEVTFQSSFHASRAARSVPNCGSGAGGGSDAKAGNVTTLLVATVGCVPRIVSADQSFGGMLGSLYSPWVQAAGILFLLSPATLDDSFDVDGSEGVLPRMVHASLVAACPSGTRKELGEKLISLIRNYYGDEVVSACDYTAEGGSGESTKRDRDGEAEDVADRSSQRRFPADCWHPELGLDAEAGEKLMDYLFPATKEEEKVEVEVDEEEDEDEESSSGALPALDTMESVVRSGRLGLSHRQLALAILAERLWGALGHGHGTLPSLNVGIPRSYGSTVEDFVTLLAEEHMFWSSERKKLRDCRFAQAESMAGSLVAGYIVAAVSSAVCSDTMSTLIHSGIAESLGNAVGVARSGITEVKNNLRRQLPQVVDDADLKKVLEGSHEGEGGFTAKVCTRNALLREQCAMTVASLQLHSGQREEGGTTSAQQPTEGPSPGILKPDEQAWEAHRESIVKMRRDIEQQSETAERLHMGFSEARTLAYTLACDRDDAVHRLETLKGSVAGLVTRRQQELRTTLEKEQEVLKKRLGLLYAELDNLCAIDKEKAHALRQLEAEAERYWDAFTNGCKRGIGLLSNEREAVHNAVKKDDYCPALSAGIKASGEPTRSTPHRTPVRKHNQTSLAEARKCDLWFRLVQDDDAKLSSIMLDGWLSEVAGSPARSHSPRGPREGSTSGRRRTRGPGYVPPLQSGFRVVCASSTQRSEQVSPPLRFNEVTSWRVPLGSSPHRATDLSTQKSNSPRSPRTDTAHYTREFGDADGTVHVSLRLVKKARHHEVMSVSSMRS